MGILNMAKGLAAKAASPVMIDKFEPQILTMIDKAMDLAAPLVSRRVKSLRESDPEATNQDLLDQVAARFVKSASVTAGATGAVGFMPGIGTAAAIGLSAAQLSAFFTQTAYFVLLALEIEGLQAIDKDQRRGLMLTALLGPDGPALAARELGTTSSLWAQSILKMMAGAKGPRLNKFLAKYAARRAKKAATKQLLGRAMPLGLGALVGYFGTRKIAREVVAGAYAGLGHLELPNFDETGEADPEFAELAEKASAEN
ncbi:hypothetical protein BK816_02855 [Boudabousia tangfeifanii]|uniref:Di-and tripeptidase n=1 Tax=Boudabousia tangfeifanii TaxID=1912795 RepID=A0A1D9MJK4_9ACTO|nr:hypothetical protein [Boudabousia tangfeifanii]AOZ72369.1 hypothetical protein BK816_02855 [Boudabousia tangfeifanii]